MSLPVYAMYSRPEYFSQHSGLLPFVHAVGATPILYGTAWQAVQERSWTLGHLLRRLGQMYYGSEWNALIPVWHEWAFARQMAGDGPCVAHFVFAEFAGPRWTWPLRRKHARLVGSFHCSARRQRQVLGALPRHAVYDCITVVSASQVAFFLERGVEKDRIRVLPHGVDTDYFCPADAGQERRGDGPLAAALVGSTERDHEFAVALLEKLPAGTLDLSVCTDAESSRAYGRVPGATILPHLSDERLLDLYRKSDLLLMPMLDCTANNAILEAMACGTPVMTNRVGGVPEYVDGACNIVMEGKNADEWADRLVHLARNREEVWGKRQAVREWVLGFGWDRIAPLYLDLYREALASSA